MKLPSRSLYRAIDWLINLQMKAAGLRYKELSSGGFVIRYWDSGINKPELILLQAFTAESKYTWRKQVKSLGRKYRLIIPNLIYFGGSTSKDKLFTVEEQSMALMALVNHLQLSSVVLCGASYGGIVSASFAHNHPHLVKKLILLGTPLKFLTEADKEEVYKKNKASGRVQLLIPDNFERLKILVDLAYTIPPKIPLFIYRSIYENLYLEQAEERRSLLKNFETEQKIYDAMDYSYKIPVLLIWGAEDKMIPVRVGKELAAHMGEATKLEIVPKTSHLPNLERPSKFNKIVLRFLKD